MLTIWGRTNSINVQKVLWACTETGVAYERIDAGMQFGRNNEPDYLAMNPNGKVPTLVDGDFVLWESNAILRYIAQEYGVGSSLYPPAARERASIDRWLDWVLSTLQPIDRTVFQGLIRSPADKRDMVALQKSLDEVSPLWRMIEARLEDRDYVEGAGFSLADLCLGVYARRWFGYEGLTRPDLPRLAHWYERISDRPGFQHHVAAPLT